MLVTWRGESSPTHVQSRSNAALYNSRVLGLSLPLRKVIPFRASRRSEAVRLPGPSSLFLAIPGRMRSLDLAQRRAEVGRAGFRGPSPGYPRVLSNFLPCFLFRLWMDLTGALVRLVGLLRVRRGHALPPVPPGLHRLDGVSLGFQSDITYP